MKTVTATCYFVNGTFVQNGGEWTACQAISNEQDTASMSWKLSMLSWRLQIAIYIVIAYFTMSKNYDKYTLARFDAHQT